MKYLLIGSPIERGLSSDILKSSGSIEKLEVKGNNHFRKITDLAGELEWDVADNFFCDRNILSAQIEDYRYYISELDTDEDEISVLILNSEDEGGLFDFGSKEKMLDILDELPYVLEEQSIFDYVLTVLTIKFKKNKISEIEVEKEKISE